MFRRPKVTTLTEAKAIHKLHYGAYNWEQEILANTDAKIKCCSWCGWSDFDVNNVASEGGYQEIECEKHGKVTVVVPCSNIAPFDFLDNLFCPFCK